MNFGLSSHERYMVHYRRFRDTVRSEKFLCLSEPENTWAYFVSLSNAGFTLEDEGRYLSGVFSYGKSNALHHIVTQASKVASAMTHRGLYLHCYEPLIRLYAAQGFEVLSSRPFDTAPTPIGWKQSMGEPRIYHMVKPLP